MPAAKKTAVKKVAAKKTAAKVSKTDAVALLTADHKRVKKLFKAFDKMKEDGSTADKQALAQQICAELTLHAEVEEQIFYPAVREALDQDDLLNEAEVEHASAKDLIAQILEMDPDDELYDAKVKVLGEQIEHHVKEEEEEMFPMAKKAGLDMLALADEMLGRKEEISATL